jgi:hypothetical protein
MIDKITEKIELKSQLFELITQSFGPSRALGLQRTGHPL